MASTPHVVVVGGGSTGTGIARDLAMRGVDMTLVERGPLTHGTTGRTHGLLHSGARYAVTDPTSATACVEENRVLRSIAGHCVEPTGGLFVKRPEDSDDYFERKLDACADCTIPTEELSGADARAIEPHLADDVERAIRVPDGAVDPVRLCVANALSAEDHGARIETHARVTDLLTDRGDVVGVRVTREDATGSNASTTDSGASDATEDIAADHVVNATGAWAGQIAGMAGVDVDVRGSKGAMTVVDVGEIETVINRCRPQSDGDIVVPRESTAVLGTTDEPVDDPESYPQEEWEVELLIDELSPLLPVLADARTIRSYWGVRPLYEPTDSERSDSRAVTRDFFCLDHAARDGVAGLTTVVGGKLTTHRLMAERASDSVCDRLGVSATCRTPDVALPGGDALDDAMDDYGLPSPAPQRGGWQQ